MLLKTKKNAFSWKRSLTRATQKQQVSRKLTPTLKEKVDWLNLFLNKSSLETLLIHFPRKIEYCKYLLSEINQIQSAKRKMDKDWRLTRLMNVELKIANLKKCISDTNKVKQLIPQVPNVPLKTGFPLRLKKSA
uniref:Uncharacterized protein n=1 Tax=Candidatus Kentrum sp. SD TaxID=2126332 RepID=A0A451BRM7_9GAMM|nr:MAG: hypothetical protein BECKSD772D_GA0070982_11773 [Candidatus Kentron sp. SD]